MTDIILLPPGPMPFLRNMTWNKINDGFNDNLEFGMYTDQSIEVDMYGRRLPERMTSRFVTEMEYAEDNTW